MFARKSLGAVLATSLAGSVIAMTAGAALAAPYTPQADDSKAAPVAADLIGVGSDTSQHAVFSIAKAWNDGQKSTYGQSFDIATFGALGGDDLNLPGGTLARPNGSTNGKATLYGAGNQPAIDFARSSDPVKAGAEADAGLKAFPFALDTVVMGVSGATTSHAPANLTIAQLVEIYGCTKTNWSDFGGAAGTILPLIPQSGSGTEKFFKAQLAANGLAAYGACVKDTVGSTPVQEHSDTLIKNDANAIVPISKGRAALLGGTVRTMTDASISFKRALYNVVRGTDVDKAGIQAAFGVNGIFCAASSAALIKAAGFDQLATPAHGGACGSPVTSTTNFALNAPVATATALTGTSTSAGALTLIAKVTGSSAPVGKVTFTEGSKVLAANVPLVSGQATKALRGLTPGRHAVKAVFTPGDAIFLGSERTAAVSVKAAAAPVVKKAIRIKESFPATVKKGKKAAGKLTFSARTSGTVKLYDGKKLIKAVKVTNGTSAKVAFKLTKKGKHRLKAVFAGNAQYLASSLSFTIKRK